MKSNTLESLRESIAGAGAVAWIRPRDVSAGPEEQARDVFRQIDAVAPWPRIVRTWFYLRDIDSWYGGFNRVRTAHFAERGVSPPPASTGIGLRAEEIGDAAIVAAVLAAPPGEAWRPVESPLQVPAVSYRSNFSRAAAAGGMVYVSGTASILPGSSEVAFPGDLAAQMDCALRAVEAILASRGASFAGTRRAVAYVKNAADIPAVRERLAGTAIPPRNLLVVRADVCRAAWLFEIELDCLIV